MLTPPALDRGIGRAFSPKAPVTMNGTLRSRLCFEDRAFRREKEWGQCQYAPGSLSLFIPGFMELSFHNLSSKGEAVATQAKKSAVAVPGRLNPCEELMRGVDATMVTTLGAVLMPWLRHAGARGFAGIERSAITTENFHR
jgi:hypothetical protein